MQGGGGGGKGKEEGEEEVEEEEEEEEGGEGGGGGGSVRGGGRRGGGASMGLVCIHGTALTLGHPQGWAAPLEPGTCHEYASESETQEYVRCASLQDPVYTYIQDAHGLIAGITDLH